MIKLKIIEKNKYKYMLEDDDERIYSVSLDFFDIDIEGVPDKGDHIYINEELLNPKYEGYNSSYTFGSMENKYGKKSISIDDIDVIKVVKEKTEIYLKRLYG